MKRFDVRYRLSATFCLLAALLFVVGWQGVHHLRQLDREMQNVIYDRLSEEQQVREAFQLSDLNSRLLLSIFLLDEPDEIKGLLVQRAANSERISGLIRAIEPRLNTEEEKRLLAAVEAARKPYVESYKQALAKLLDGHQRNEAQKMMMEHALPYIGVYHAAWSAFTQCQVDKIEQGIKQSKADFVAAQRRLVFLIILACLITAAIAVYVTFRISREIAGRQRAEEALNQSYDQLEQRIRQRTEELGKTNQSLQAEITRHKRTEESLRKSEEKFQGLFESSRDAIMTLEPPSWSFTSGNPASLKMFRAKNQEQFISLGPGDVSPDHQPDGRASAGKAREMIETALREGSHFFEWTHRRLDGEEFPAEVLMTRMEQGGKVMLQATVRDITERKRVEEVQTLLASIVQSSDDAIISGSLDGNILTWNQGAERIYGYAASEVIGKSAAILVPPDQLEEIRVILEKIRRGEHISHHETVRCTKDGRRIDVSLSVSPMRDASGILIGVSTIARDITERKRAAETLRASQQIIEGIINAIPVSVFWKDKNHVFLGCNAVFARDAGFADPKDIIGKDDYQMVWRDQAEKFRADDRQVIESGCSKLSIEESQTTPAGNTIRILTSKIPLRCSNGEISGVLGTYMDITERKRLEAQLFQSQKMETVGKLAGGIAHEFNSIMTAIIGHSELLLIDLPRESPLCKNAREIRQSADRAAALTRQLLAYGRKQILQPGILDLNSILAGMENMLRHLAGDKGEVRITPGAGLKAVKADAGQIEQVIVNIAMNAADAMPNGGTLSLETANVTLDESYASRFPGLKAGEYVMLAISDTGAGMSEAVRTRVFEPFFSTKPVGQGTGLGLATCYGILKQSGGHISVYSEPARGTTFRIYLPPVEAPANIPVQRIDAPDLPRGTETILLVEDDCALREMAVILLTRLGYTVLSAANGVEALSLKQQRGVGHVDLLFTDVVMPHMSGKELADRVRVLYPHTRILFTSAYTENSIVHQGVLDAGVALLQKPFTPGALACKVRETLDTQ